MSTPKLFAPKFLLSKLRPGYPSKERRRVLRERAIKDVYKLCRIPHCQPAPFTPCIDLEYKSIRAELVEHHLRRSFLIGDRRLSRLLVEGWAKETRVSVESLKTSLVTSARLDQELNPIAHKSSHQAEPYTESKRTSAPSLTVADCELLQAIDDMMFASIPEKYASIMSSNSYASGYLRKHIANYADTG